MENNNSELYNYFLSTFDQLGLEKQPNELNDKLSMAWIPFESLVVTGHQMETFDIHHVMEICENWHPALARACSVAHVGEHFILWEGQHSALAYYITGFDKVPCMIYESDNLDFKNLPSIEKFDRYQLANLIKQFMEETGAETVEDVRNLIRPPDNYQA